MTTGGEALEQALGLLRAPALRASLRARPLPAGMEEVLAIASGSGERARRAADRTGYAAGELADAARFYVQQVLLADDADAYRVLGADRGAAQSTLREHHRLLLRWLHPDRSQGDAPWETAMSARVNEAWQQLRSGEARARYDAARVDDGGQAAAGAGVVRPDPVPARPARPVMSPRPVVPAGPGVAARERPAAALGVALLGLLCVVLVWFAATRTDLPEPDARPAQAAPVAAPAGAAAAAAPAKPEPPVAAIAAPTGAGIAATAAPASNGIATIAAPAVDRAAAMPAATNDRLAAAGAAAAATLAPPERPVAAKAAASAPSEPPVVAIAAPADGRIVPITAPAETKAEVADPLRLFHEAEAVLRETTAWLSAAEAREPAWLDVAAGRDGARARAGLRKRHATSPAPRMQLEAPHWSLGDRAASMLGAYRLDGASGPVETGVLHVELQRHAEQWRITRLHLEPAR